LFVKLEHLLGPRSGDGEHFAIAGWDFPARRRKAWMGAHPVKLNDNVDDSTVDALNFLEPARDYDLVEWTTTAARLSAARA
jgi:hypothetical protein